MSGFDAGWLALREPHDHAARAKGPLRLVQGWVTRCPRLEVVDLGSGTGSSLRALAGPLGGSWTLVERDPALIAAGTALLADASVPWRYREADLAEGLDDAVPAGTGLVTASALIDLVGADWLRQLVELVARRRCALLVALSYDGRVEWTPRDPDDARVTALFDRDQRRDKGLGTALGPDAAAALASALADLPGVTRTAASDWLLEPTDAACQSALLDGIAEAAARADPAAAERVAAWRSRRRRAIEAGGSRVRVGHRDVAYVPAGGSSAA